MAGFPYQIPIEYHNPIWISTLLWKKFLIITLFGDVRSVNMPVPVNVNVNMPVNVNVPVNATREHEKPSTQHPKTQRLFCTLQG